MTTGYVYCMTNESMHGVVKIGMTTRKMEARLNEANKRDTFKIPTLFVVAIAKKVNDPKDKEQTLHKILTHLGRRVEQRREFFNASVEDVKLYFDLMDGELWQPKNDVVKQSKKSKKEVEVEYAESSEEEELDSESEDESSESSSNSNKMTFTRIKPNKHLISHDKIKKYKSIGKKGCRDLKKCLKPGQKIRHIINIKGKEKSLVGIYDSLNKIIVYIDKNDGTEYICSTLTEFVEAHYNMNGLKMTDKTVWRNCTCKIDGEWISMEWLPPYTKK